MLIHKIVQELQDIPEEKLAEIYGLIYHFRLALSKERSQSCISNLLIGKLKFLLEYKKCQA
ncbi:hypothetical protein [Pseudanabaena sp. ABRG5-3]|uniref:hypothetical protein n=1 Tax=Pseudanabaena sp. ABRG5-3 TaxID=685565 RepID=UPI000DC6E0BC|nr:hypothetical protein [Pseudanabaena sp. ABRG5-3]BBC23799.1 hypothetical protein ABRG53_1542 [Pseudanabaena sp. ABRG5-3]